MNRQILAVFVMLLAMVGQSHGAGFERFLDKLMGWQIFEGGRVKIKKSEDGIVVMQNLENIPEEYREMVRKKREEWNKPYQPYYYRIEVRRDHGEYCGEEIYSFFQTTVTLEDLEKLRNLGDEKIAEGDELKLVGGSVLLRGKGSWRYCWVFDQQKRFISLIYDHEIDWLLQKLASFEG